ncbi:MAG: ABC transporter ATP-binding protein [Nitrospinota bacterium]
MSPVLELREVSKHFQRGHPVVCGLSFSIPPGEIVCFLGPSGAGKTTTLRLIAGFEVPEEGTIQVGARRVAGPGTFIPPEGRGVGMVFQDYALFPHLSVAENVAFGLWRLDPAERSRCVEEMLEIVGLTPYANRYPHELSGGQQQRVALARALAPRPSLVLLDEPFSNLDAHLRAQMLQEANSILRSQQITAILVIHDQEDALMVADRVGILHEGRLEQLAPPEEVYRRPASRFVAGFLGKADFLPGRVMHEGVATEIGLFPNADGLRLGARVEVMVRPDEVELIPDNRSSALVVSRHFRGSGDLLCVQLPSGARVHSLQPPSLKMEPGHRVQVVPVPTRPVVFPAAGEGPLGTPHPHSSR